MYERTVYIYGLVDPRTEEVRYIGSSVNPLERLNNHLVDARRSPSSPKGAWIASLIAAGMVPRIEIIEKVGESGSCEAEARVIQEYRERGSALVNTHDIVPWRTPSRKYPGLIQAGRIRMLGYEGRVNPLGLVNFRKRHGLSRQALALTLGTDDATIEKWEAGKAPIPGNIIYDLMRIEGDLDIAH